MNGSCQSCQISTYKEVDDNIACTPCADIHEITMNTASTSHDDCVCEASFVRQGQASCLNDSTNTKCVCESGKGYDAKNRRCFACPRGSYKVACSLEQCRQCPAHESTGTSYI